MKRVFVFSLAIFTLFLSAGCNKTLESKIKEGKATPQRISAEFEKASYVTMDPEEKWRDNVDTVLDVTITGYIGGFDDINYGFSLFSAHTNSVIWGDEYDEFVLDLGLTPKMGQEDMPLPQKGNRLLLFLTNLAPIFEKAIDAGDIPEGIPTSFGMAEEYKKGIPVLAPPFYGAIMDIAEYNGTTYVLDRYNLFTDSAVQNKKLTPVGAKTATELKRLVIEADPLSEYYIVSNYWYAYIGDDGKEKYSAAFKMDDMKAYIATVAK
ncbi:MAG: hypothetical protein IJO93_06685 [Clostridia bacterium]|nr:hypothetical protein [Clostridia bacterium]